MPHHCRTLFYWVLALGAIRVQPGLAQGPPQVDLEAWESLQGEKGERDADEPGKESEDGPGEAETEEEASAPLETAERATRTEGFIPKLEVFFPEGDLDLRVNRLVRKVFLEGQLKYNFLEGDITAFLRYRYYGFRRTYQITAFDAIEFDDLERLSDEFSRVRGLLLLTQWPHDYHRRSFFLGEMDRIISNREDLRFSNNRTNSFVRLGHQIGTPRDERLNAVVGESRARIERLFTPLRAIGPGDSAATAAATWSFKLGPGDFDYVKIEAEGLKRFRLGERGSLVGRLHLGSFPSRDRIRDETTDPDILEADRFSIPRTELFRLDGRENLKGLKDRRLGTEEIHSTWELYVPWFLEEKRRALGLEWENWYWILYAGAGNIGFDSQIFTTFEDYIPDVGIGFESSFRIKKYTFFLSTLAAHAFEGSGEDIELRVSLKSYR